MVRRAFPFLASLLATLLMNASPSDSSSAAYTFDRGVNISHWIGQQLPGKWADPQRFSGSDAAWIASQGFDHVRVPVDGRILLAIEGQLIHELLEPFDRAIEWTRSHGLGIILDIHYLRGNDFLTPAEENRLWQSDELQEIAVNLWRSLATKYAEVGPNLRFELLNEAVAPSNEDLNKLNRKLVSAIRAIDHDRVIYVSSNRWGSFSTASDVYVFEGDPNIHYTFHFYEPHIFTHQKARWNDWTRIYDQNVAFPTTLSDLDPLPADHWLRQRYEKVRLDRDWILAQFAELAEWANSHGAAVYIGEFGVYEAADDRSTRNWVQAVTDACRRHGFSWAVWDYKGGFAIRRNGEPTPVLEGLFSHRR